MKTIALKNAITSRTLGVTISLLSMIVLCVFYPCNAQASGENFSVGVEAKLTAIDAASGDRFGWSVAVSGNTIIVGVPHDDDAGYSSGSAYVFTRSEGGWTQQAKLTSSEATADVWFGRPVAISRDTVVLGASYEDGACPSDLNCNSGSAYIFTRSAGGWTEQAKLTASDADKMDHFGRSVAISGDTVVIMGGCSAYVFTQFDGVWTQQAKLTAADDCLNSVAISGETIVVGAGWNDDAGENSGAAYVFTRSNGVWTQQAKLTASDAAARDYFGYSVAISDNTIVVGTWDFYDAGENSGSAYVFTRSNDVWTQQAKLTASDAAAGESFGHSVAITDNTIVVGAYRHDDVGENSGSAYVFTRSNDVWTEHVKLTALDAAADDLFGGSVAISDGTIVVGATEDDDAGKNSGSASVYRLWSGGDQFVTLAFGSATSFTENESEKDHLVTVELSIQGGGVLSEAVSVEVTDNGTGTATFGVDYVAFIPETVIFPAGSIDGATQSVIIRIIQDSHTEAEETIRLMLSNITGAALIGGQLTHKVIINDDEVDRGLHKVYWIGRKTIQRTNLDGSERETLVSGGPRSFFRDIALDLTNEQMYWSDSGLHKIQRANLDGSDVEDIISSPTPEGIVLDVSTNTLYWIDSTLKAIQQAKFDGTNVKTVIKPGPQSNPSGLTLDLSAKKIYWTNAYPGARGIFRANINGTAVEEVIVDYLGVGSHLALDGNGEIYVTGSKIVTTNLDGTKIRKLVDTNAQDIALDIADGKMYWMASGIIRRADLDGTNLRNVLNTGSGSFAFVTKPWLSFVSPTSVTGDKRESDHSVLVRLNYPNGGSLVEPVTVDIVDKGTGTATAESDYAGFSPTTLTFPRGASDGLTQIFNLHIISDAEREGLETVALELRNIQGPAALPEDRLTHEVAINDETPDWNVKFLSLSNETVNESVSNYSTWIQLRSPGDGALDEPLTFDLTDNGTGTATPGTDYKSFPGATRTFPASSRDGALLPVQLTIRQDRDSENDETIVLELSGLVGPGKFDEPRVHYITIEDDEPRSTSDSKLFWAEEHRYDNGPIRIRGAKLDGSNVVDLIVEERDAEPFDIAIDPVENKMYWSDSRTRTIYKANLDGSHKENLIEGLKEPRAIAVDVIERKIYWNEIGTKRIKRANLDGTGIKGLITNISVDDIALDEIRKKIYWTSDGTIQRANRDRTELETIVMESSLHGSAKQIVLDVLHRKIYWVSSLSSNNSTTITIRRANLDGTASETLIALTTGSRFDVPRGLALDLDQQKLYFGTRDGEIKSADLSGSNIQSFVRPFGSLRGQGLSAHPVNGKLYWIDQNRINRISLDRSGREVVIPHSLTRTVSLDVDTLNRKMYWASSNIGKIHRANLDGTGIEALITTGLMFPSSLTLDTVAEKMYWLENDIDLSNNGKIKRANVDGTDVEEVILAESSFINDLALDPVGSKMYWTESKSDTIKRANLDGTNIEDLFVPELECPRSIAIDTTRRKMYWANDCTGKLQRANLDGSESEDFTDHSLPRTRDVFFDVTFGRIIWADGSRIRWLKPEGTPMVNTIVSGNVSTVAIAPGPEPIIEFHSERSTAINEAVDVHPVLVELRLPPGIALTESVTVDVVDTGTGTATPNGDYVAFSPETLTFPTGSTGVTTLTFELHISQDSILEEDEAVNLRLVNVHGPGSLLGTTQLTHKVIIVDDDDIPVANDDTAEITGNVPVTINVVSNDTDLDGTIDPSSVKLIQPRYVASFDGADDKIIWGDLGLNQTPLISKFVRFRTADTNGVLFDTQFGSGADGGLSLGGGMLRLRCAFTNAGVQVIDVVTADIAADGNWHSAGFTYDGSTLTTYFDGAVSGTPLAIPDDTIRHNYPSTCGGRILSDSLFLAGELADFVVHTSALSETDIANYHKGEVPTDNMVLWGKMDEDDYSNGLADSSGNNHIGTSAGAVPIPDPLAPINPENGTAVNNGDGTVTYTPNPGFFGEDRFEYTVKDNEGAMSNIATVTITVLIPNEPPTAEDDVAETIDGESVVINVVDNDTDGDGTIDPSTVQIVQPRYVASFDGVNDKIMWGDLGLGATPTLSKFIRFRTTDLSGVLFDTQFGSGADGGLYLGSELLRLRCAFNDAGVQSIDIVSADVAAAGTWHTAGFTYDGSMLKTYFDGVPTGTPVAIPDDTIRHNYPGTCGGRVFSNSMFFAGELADFVVYSSGLSATAVMSYHDGTPPPNDLVLWRKMDEGNYARRLADASGNGHRGTSAGATPIFDPLVPVTPENGSVVNNGDGTVTYTPDPDFIGEDHFEYTVRDNDEAVSNVATVTITTVPIPNPTADVRFTVASSTTPVESAVSDRVSVKLTGLGKATISEAIMIDVIDTGAGSATPDGDYAALPETTLTFPAGSGEGAMQFVTLTILDDQTFESDETIELRLTNLRGPGVLGTPSTHTVVIPDGETGNKNELYYHDRTGGINDVLRRTGPSEMVMIRSDLTELAVDFSSEKMYYATHERWIQRANLDGSDVENVFRLSGVRSITALAIDISNETMYWSNGIRINRMNLNGTELTGIVTKNIGSLTDLALDNVNNKVYWSDSSTRTIHRANLNGTDAEELISTELPPQSIDVDLGRDKIYWTSYSLSEAKIQRANLDGTGVEELIVSGVSKPGGLTLDSAAMKLYWVDAETLGVYRANVDGSGVEELFRTENLASLQDLALDITDNTIYWAGGDAIQRSLLDGFNTDDLVVGFRSPTDIAFDNFAEKLYWTDGRLIKQSNLNGTNVELIVSRGLTAPHSIDVDGFGGKVYWTDTTLNTIQRANLDGTDVEDLVSGLSNPTDIAVDMIGRKLYWTNGGDNTIQRAKLDGSDVDEFVTSNFSGGSTGLQINIFDGKPGATGQYSALQGRYRLTSLTVSSTGMTEMESIERISMVQVGKPRRRQGSIWPSILSQKHCTGSILIAIVRETQSGDPWTSILVVPPNSSDHAARFLTNRFIPTSPSIGYHRQDRSRSPIRPVEWMKIRRIRIVSSYV